MADSIASPLLQSLLNRLDSIFLSFDEGGDEILIRSRTVVAAVKDLATVAEQRFEMPEEIRGWLAEVKRLAYRLDSLLDDYEQQMRKVRNQKLKSCCFGFLTRTGDQRPIEDVIEKLSRLSGEGDWPLESNWRPDLYFRLNSGTNLLGLEPEIVGRDTDRDKIIGLLTSKTNEICRVVSIVGGGGVGKTTLARLVYNDESIGRNFRFKYWVSAGNNRGFNVQRIGEAICSKKFSILDDFEIGVRFELMGKRFLIVLDNLCIEEMDQWLMLRNLFSVGSYGSAVIITTRSIDVADGLSNMPLYYLQPLHDADCLDLFRRVVLLPWKEKEEIQNTELLEISKILVANCGGLPLAVRILGALLPYNGDMGDWLSAAALALLELQKYSYGFNILKVLHLSYDLLPSNLKQCFAYCSIFPREYWISKEKLLQLWKAEGFLQTSGSNESFYDLAEDCFMKLLQRFFYEDIVRDDSGTIFCRMHDVVYDFAVTVSSTTCSAMGPESSKLVLEELRHFSLVFEFEPSARLRYLSNKEDLQTLVFLSSKFDSIPETIFSRFSHLHVLDFSHSGISELPVSLGALKHLRYLDASRTHIRKIPETISNLKYLQTLELSECYNLEGLPKTVPQLTNLVNLGISSCCSLTYLPSGIGKLRLLEKLSTFVLGKQSDSAKLNELSELNLKERLEIKNLENVTKEAEARNAKLYKQASIHSLTLSWGQSYVGNAQLSSIILENLHPPENLRDFCLKGYKGSRFPSWMNRGLRDLSGISLINCSCQVLPPLGQLPSLRFLYLKGMSEVRSIGQEFYGDGGFPCLEQFEIYDMPGLEEWKSMEIFTIVEGSSVPSSLEVESFPFLDKLVVKGCHRLTALPVIPNLRSLALCDSNEMLLRSIVHLPSLSSLVIEKFKLEFLNCYFKSFLSVEKLTLYNCDHLDHLFEDNQASSSLKHLSILYCDGLMSLPSDLRSLTSLQRFEVMECGQLNDISVLESLSSLQELSIEGCLTLHSMPSGLHNLTNLQRLVIKGCPALEMENDEDWFKIAHLPYIEIELKGLLLED
ncbi:Malectin/receptor protein kinase family protein [Hibiscus syriacus]|uniref:Malectin/receptor protein kinase family protein n=1 Tax=Hibiscus syriacus TaxID=106335 RepID=A0A6A3AI20_HIBSY|nr:putative disease resistance protein RGA1 [Hibiscus syriacus]KAE8702935.1 Malectin/receptor protein kinase family protein [Hibiscus syriacus]